MRVTLFLSHSHSFTHSIWITCRKDVNRMGMYFSRQIHSQWQWWHVTSTNQESTLMPFNGVPRNKLMANCRFDSYFTVCMLFFRIDFYSLSNAFKNRLSQCQFYALYQRNVSYPIPESIRCQMLLSFNNKSQHSFDVQI